ncbi:preprotein translocase subunit YajC [Arenibaculum pallidiluteum]|uniref:preprotein translocase subunit YajC n=1 Tax=Arenibaculum pallidiluteum TaxID=2812559 RepID=UPI001A960C8D|nr:preprotein translocase subunit YajC [Arenibaculum pallidiluteum]
MLVSTAWAQTGPAPGAFEFASFLPLVLIFIVFYFLLIRPQQKRMKEHRTMLDALRRGDRVVTGGGIIGTVTKADADEVTVEIAENVRVRVLKSTITSILQKTEPVKGGGAGDKPAEAPAPAAPPAGASPLGRMFGRK